MVKTSNSILIYEKGIDLQHLASHLENNEINAFFEKDKSTFLKKCITGEYSLLAISLIDKGIEDEDILDSISSSSNDYIPVLLIIDNKDTSIMQSAIKYRYDFITFPFSPDEFVIRVQAAGRKKETEDAIHRTVLSYTKLFDNFPLGIVQTDEHGNFISFNKEFLNLSEMNESDLSDVNFFQLCHPDDYFIKRKQLDRLLRQEVNMVNYEIRIINNEGKTAVCKVTASTIWENRDVITAYTFILEKTE